MRYVILILVLISSSAAIWGQSSGPLVFVYPKSEKWSVQEDFEVEDLSSGEIKALKDGREKFEKAKAEWEQLQEQVRRQHGEITINDPGVWCGEVRQRDVVLRGKYALITIHPSQSCISW